MCSCTVFSHIGKYLCYKSVFIKNYYKNYFNNLFVEYWVFIVKFLLSYMLIKCSLYFKHFFVNPIIIILKCIKSNFIEQIICFY